MTSSCTHRCGRRGVASIWLLIVLALLTVLLTITTKDLLQNRRALTSRGNRMQAAWLARAGVEIAAAHLLDKDDAWKGGAVELLPAGKVRIEVKPMKGSADVFEVASEGQFPSDDPRGSKQTSRRRFRRVTEGNRVRLIAQP
jgi:hypothetical protein